MSYFKNTDTLFDIISAYPETIDVFKSNGFPQMGDPEKRERFGRSISLASALMLKKVDADSYISLLNETIDGKRSVVDATLEEKSAPAVGDALKVTGLLPCPVRLPLLEEFNRFHEGFRAETGLEIDHELKAASMGLDWVEEHLEGMEDAGDLPDLFLSAGFDMFFDEQKFGHFKDQGVFEDTTGLDSFNTDFDGLDLKDPRGHYGIISVVPAVFLVNTEELGDRPMPRSWEDILSPEFEKRVSLPVGDFDLFNGILLNIHKTYGAKGVVSLGRSLLESMHPSQMVKSNRRKDEKPIVTIMPYFFTKMVMPGGGMEAVWPEDGAIISPIFLLAKKQKQEELQPVIDFFASREVGEVLAHNGRFPSVRPDVDNRLGEKAPFQWLGWDYIYENDIAELIKHCEELFNLAVEDAAAEDGIGADAGAAAAASAAPENTKEVV